MTHKGLSMTKQWAPQRDGTRFHVPVWNFISSHNLTGDPNLFPLEHRLKPEPVILDHSAAMSKYSCPCPPTGAFDANALSSATYPSSSRLGAVHIWAISATGATGLQPRGPLREEHRRADASSPGARSLTGDPLLFLPRVVVAAASDAVVLAVPILIPLPPRRPPPVPRGRRRRRRSPSSRIRSPTGAPRRAPSWICGARSRRAARAFAGPASFLVASSSTATSRDAYPAMDEDQPASRGSATALAGTDAAAVQVRVDVRAAEHQHGVLQGRPGGPRCARGWR